MITKSQCGYFLTNIEPHYHMLQNFYRSLYQMFQLETLGLVLQVMILSGLIMALLFALLLLGLFWIDYTAIPWLGDWLLAYQWSELVASSTFFLVLSAGLLLCFPYVVLLVATLLQDRAITLVEQRYYPELPAPLRVRTHDIMYAHAVFLSKILLVNIVFLPVYIVLLFTGVGVFVLAAVLNGYFLGNEFFDMLASRRLVLMQRQQLVRQHRISIHFYGILVYLMMLIPLWNLLMPLFACMLFTHVFYGYCRDDHLMVSAS